MTQRKVASAEAYYQAMGDQDFAGMAQRLHPDARLVTPMEELTREGGGSCRCQATPQPHQEHQSSIKVHARFASEDQAMPTSDMEFAQPIGVTRTAVLMTFRDSLIARSELFI